MSMTSDSRSHLDDVALLRHLDGESDGGPSNEAHLAECLDCSRRLALVRQWSTELSMALARSPVAPLDPHSRAEQRAAIEARLAHVSGGRSTASRARNGRSPLRSPWLRAAAGIVVVAGIAAAAPPMRNWITSHVATITRHAATPQPSTTGTVPLPAHNEVFFDVPGVEMVLSLASRQRVGNIVVTRAGDASSSASVVGGLAELVVMPDGLRIRNDSASVSSYVLRAGTGVQRVRIRIRSTGAASEMVIAVPDSGSVRRPLGGSR